HLEKIVELKKRESKYMGLEGHPYNGLLDSFEEGMTAEKLKNRFEVLKQGILTLLRKIESSKRYREQKLILMKREFSKEEQIELSKDVAKRIGLTEDRTQIDFSEHPFTNTIDLDDVRITTNVRKDPMFCFGSTIHETGHALYELQFPEKHRFDVLADAPSLGMHESQSRFWENMIALNKPFWKYYFPVWNKKFHLRNDFPQWFREVNQVVPGMIRIESDEIHYCLHIILRFELELGLISGEIRVKDLPKVWNEKMKEFFGKTPETVKDGVLQDVHWAEGYFGYFPTYALGTIYAAQLYNSLKRDIPDIENDISRGNFSKVREWLKENIHKYGRKMFAEDIVKKTCGEGLNVNVFLNYLNEKYGEIYDLK
ncbi:MAG: carboxypeptidase M32, partial [Nanoarchaeota archaeon]